jgi:outer membrane lipoprotein SlyB
MSMFGKATVVVLASLLLVGCKQNVSPDTYSVGSVGQVNRAIRGEVLSARPVQIAGTNTLGATTGAVGGGIAGSQIGGGGRQNALGALGGAVVGGLVGAAVEEGATQQTGIEYVIKAENGALLTVVQGSEPSFAPGAKVIVLYGSRSRVIADGTGGQ